MINKFRYLASQSHGASMVKATFIGNGIFLFFDFLPVTYID
jgi:hypothetical protein